MRTILSRYHLDVCLPSLLFLVNADAMHVLLNEDFCADDIKLNLVEIGAAGGSFERPLEIAIERGPC